MPNKVTKYSVGDKVMVRSDIQEDKDYFMGNNIPYMDIATEEMVAFAGKQVTISEISEWNNEGEFSYTIEEDKGYWSWTDEMFVDAPPSSPPPSKVTG